MFKVLIILIIDNAIFPLTILAFAFLWLFLLPEYWWELMLVTLVFLVWFFSRISRRFEKYN
ncbi:hypothetical protein CYR55_09575 [Chimaeribacter californicus]|uniref:Uncharacterized protein n=1 Tax=Chimaeribacter californicus TaxID=2060067 RepID=A0A2N5E8G8_9GAMM|nr:hypothetical protein CYR55_09575 [Chimaeribacter californicus]